MSASPPERTPPLLDVLGLSVTYDTEIGPLETVRQVSFSIQPGEIFGLVGESGSGKTTLARAVVRYLPRNGRISQGRVSLQGEDLGELDAHQMRRLWGARIGMVHQDPSASVNPSIPVGEQVAEVARQHLSLDRAAAWQKALEMLGKVQLPEPQTTARRYAHQLSGGMLQRIVIASALVTSPQLLIMDEPTTALDVTTEAVILDLVHDLLQEYRTAVLYITHHLGVVRRICDRVGVMYAGELVEQGSLKQVFSRPRHPYTIGLLSCVPRVNLSKLEVELNTIPGRIPRPESLPPGCIFAPRCAMAEEACNLSSPPLVEVASGHYSACLRWQEIDEGYWIKPAALPPASIEEKAAGEPVLEARNLRKYYRVRRGGLSGLLKWKPDLLRAVEDISFQVQRAATLGIVGESGCGKTTLVRAIAGLVEASGGEIILEGQVLPYKLSQRERSTLKRIQVVFQNPDASLNPQLPVGKSVGRPLVLLGNLRADAIEQRVGELFQAVNLPPDYIRRLPHELSGGEKQRVAIARAFAAQPSLVLLDEPISSLDVSVQASLMNLLIRLQQEQGSAYLFISHDLAAVRHLSDWIAVVYLGQLWEVGSAREVFAPPYHPYTEALLSAIPLPDLDLRQERIRLQGSVPSSIDIPSGCRFHTRCPRKIGPICESEEPPWQKHSRDHRICCHIPLEELREIQAQVLAPAMEVGR